MEAIGGLGEEIFLIYGGAEGQGEVWLSNTYASASKLKVPLSEICIHLSDKTGGKTACLPA